MSGEFKGKKATIIPLCKHSEWHASVALFYSRLYTLHPTLSTFPSQNDVNNTLFRTKTCTCHKKALSLQRNCRYKCISLRQNKL